MPYTTDWTDDKGRGCPKCQQTKVKWRKWESPDGAHEDHEFHCFNCGHEWWVDGSDY